MIQGNDHFAEVHGIRLSAPFVIVFQIYSSFRIEIVSVRTSTTYRMLASQLVSSLAFEIDCIFNGLDSMDQSYKSKLSGSPYRIRRSIPRLLGTRRQQTRQPLWHGRRSQSSDNRAPRKGHVNHYQLIELRATLTVIGTSWSMLSLTM